MTMWYLSTEFCNEFLNQDNLDISAVINSSKTRQYLCFSCDCYFVLTVYTCGHWALFLSFILRLYKFFLIEFSGLQKIFTDKLQLHNSKTNGVGYNVCYTKTLFFPLCLWACDIAIDQFIRDLISLKLQLGKISQPEFNFKPKMPKRKDH